MVMAPPPTRDSAISSCFHGRRAFLHRHSPPQSPPSHPLYPSLCSQQQPWPWDCSTIPKLQLPTTVPSKVCMTAARAVWFSFHLGCHRSTVPFSAFNVSPPTQTIAPVWGSDPCFSSPPAESRSSPTNTPISPPCSFVLPSFVWVYIFFSREGNGNPLQYSCLANHGRRSLVGCSPWGC